MTNPETITLPREVVEKMIRLLERTLAWWPYHHPQYRADARPALAQLKEAME